MPEHSDIQEVEWQFDTSDLEAVERWLRAQPPTAPLTWSDKGAATQDDTYFDTEDWAVYRAGLTLRIRRFADRAEATLKARDTANEGQRSRREVTQHLDTPDADFFQSEGLVAQKLRLLSRGRPVAPLFSVHTRRHSYELRQGGVVVAELSLDEARFETPEGEEKTLHRVEVEQSHPGDNPALKSFIEALARAASLEPATLSKFESGLVTARLLPRVAPRLGSTSLSAEQTTGEFALAILRKYFRDFLSHEPGTRLGEDPEELHDMRVATRRLRAALRTFEPALAPSFQEIRSELQWVGRALGEVRDRDVQTESLQELQAGAPWEEASAIGVLVEAVTASREQARTQLLQALDSDRFTALVDTTVAALQAEAPVEVPAPAAVPITEFAPWVIRKRYRQFRRDARQLTLESDPAEYHAVRVRAKKLRYTVEFMDSLYGPPAKEMARIIAELQDLLGEHQDSHVAVDWLGELAADESRGLRPATLLFMGELRERNRGRMKELRDAWPEALRKVKRQWRVLRRALKARPEEADAEVDEVLAADAWQPRRFGPMILFRRFLPGRRPSGEAPQDATR